MLTLASRAVRVLSSVALCAVSCALAQIAAQMEPKELITSRISQYRDLGSAFKNIQDELKAATPQPLVLRLSSRQISAVARAQYDWFPASAGPQPGVKTHAKSEIWSDSAGFKQAQDDFARQAELFARAVNAGDTAQIRDRARELGEKCNACHKRFRTEIHPDE